MMAGKPSRPTRISPCPMSTQNRPPSRPLRSHRPHDDADRHRRQARAHLRIERVQRSAALAQHPVALHPHHPRPARRRTFSCASSAPTPGSSIGAWRTWPSVRAYGWSDTTIKATPLILAALGVSIAFRMRLWNIGAEGQLMIGAFFATGVALFVLPPARPPSSCSPPWPSPASSAARCWGFIPGVLKAKLNVNEIITTLMLNYVAILWNNYFIYGPWSERGFGLTPTFPRSAWLPRFTDYGDARPPSARPHRALRHLPRV